MHARGGTPDNTGTAWPGSVGGYGRVPRSAPGSERRRTMSTHDEILDDLYEQAVEEAEGSRWDEVCREVEYYSPDPESQYHKNPMGEMDIAFIDLNGRIRYVEVKSRAKDIKDGIEQLRRAKEHFEMHGFEFEGELYVDPDAPVWTTSTEVATDRRPSPGLFNGHRYFHETAAEQGEAVGA